MTTVTVSYNKEVCTLCSWVRSLNKSLLPVRLHGCSSYCQSEIWLEGCNMLHYWLL